MIKRNSRLEIVRLLAMFGIVLSHWGGHNEAIFSPDSGLLINNIWLLFCQQFGELGNALFILITGYFSINQRFTKRHIINFAITVEFYSVLVYIICLCTGICSFSVVDIVKSIFPIMYSSYWFVVPYFFLYLFIPLLNKIINELYNDKLNYLIVVLVLVETLLPIIKADTISSNFGLFILYYIIGALIRIKCSFNNTENKLESPEESGKWILINNLIRDHGFLLTGICFFILVTVSILSVVLRSDMVLLLAQLMLGRFSIFTAIISIYIFIKLASGSPFSNGFINWVSKTSFSMYLISENYNIYPWLWKKYFNNLYSFKSLGFIPKSVASVLTVMVICSVIDSFRILMFNCIHRLKNK